MVTGPPSWGRRDRSNPDAMFDPEVNFVVGKKQLGKIIDKCITKHGFTVAAGDSPSQRYAERYRPYPFAHLWRK